MKLVWAHIPSPLSFPGQTLTLGVPQPDKGFIGGEEVTNWSKNLHQTPPVQTENLRDFLGFLPLEGPAWADAAHWQRLFSSAPGLGIINRNAQKYKTHPPTEAKEI